MTKRNIYDPPHTNCPLCGDSAIEPLYEIKKFDDPFAVERCKRCGFIFMNPPFCDEHINSFYSEDYYTGNSGYSYLDERAIKESARHVWNKRIETLHKYVPSGNFLDVGSSFGGLMEAAGRFYTPYGIEISPYSGDSARQTTGHFVHIGSLLDHPFDEDFFSAITMIELIEHLKYPVHAFEACFKLLQKGGVLVIQTANMDGLQAKIYKENYNYFLPGHLSYFSRKNLAESLRHAGFTKIKAFIPVEFGLLAKLKKSKGSFNSIWDYRKWVRVSAYHMIGRLHTGNFSPTSSMVLYAFK